MKRVLIRVGILMGSLLATFVAVAIITATPLVGEVVTIHTRGAGGEWETTPLWIVDLDNASYLRSGTPDGSGWVARLRANPEVRLERAGDIEAVRLVEEPAQLQAVHEKMAEKYGWADSFVTLMGGDPTKAIPLRIEVAARP